MSWNLRTPSYGTRSGPIRPQRASAGDKGAIRALTQASPRTDAVEATPAAAGATSRSVRFGKERQTPPHRHQVLVRCPVRNRAEPRTRAARIRHRERHPHPVGGNRRPPRRRGRGDGSQARGRRGLALRELGVLHRGVRPNPHRARGERVRRVECLVRHPHRPGCLGAWALSQHRPHVGSRRERRRQALGPHTRRRAGELRVRSRTQARSRDWLQYLRTQAPTDELAGTWPQGLSAPSTSVVRTRRTTS